MSRSIHTTRSTFGRIAKTKFRSPEERAAALEQVREELRRKRRIKAGVATGRRSVEAPLAGTPVKTIPIKSIDERPFVHHAVPAEEVREVLGLLPAAATEGISEIRLTLGAQYMDEREKVDVPRDPLVGRPASQVFPHVYAGTILGTYWRATGRIFIYAYVYDVAKLPLPRELCEFYLKLHALGTLVHEVAHHHDFHCRRGRGRWLMDRRGKAEHYAEKMEFRWLREIVLPYLEQKYGPSIRELQTWVAVRGGAKVSLEYFVGENRHTGRDGVTRPVSSTAVAFEQWVERLADCRTVTESRFAFATTNYCADNYELCVQILDVILETEPCHEDALIWKASALRQLKRHEEGLAIVDRMLARQPDNTRARKGRGELLCAKKAWPTLLRNCERWEADLAATSKDLFDALRLRAVACCAMGRKATLNELIERLVNFEGRKPKRGFLIEWIYRNAGQPLPAEFVTPISKRPRIR